MMCKNNNKYVIEVLQDSPGTKSFGVRIQFSLLMSAIEDEKLKNKDPKMRAKLVELLKGMYVCYLVSYGVEPPNKVHHPSTIEIVHSLL